MKTKSKGWAGEVRTRSRDEADNKEGWYGLGALGMAGIWLLVLLSGGLAIPFLLVGGWLANRAASASKCKDAYDKDEESEWRDV